jgi:insertion element IS1 protein InsB
MFAEKQKQRVLKSFVFRMSPAHKCIYCSNESCIKKGIRNNVQKLFCKQCNRWQQTAYCNRKYSEREENLVRKFHNWGNGITAISGLLHIPKTSVLRLMIRKASGLSFSIPEESGQDYLIDELQTFVKRNTDSDRIYVISIMNKATGKIIESVAGKRRMSVISPMIQRLLKLSPGRIDTDGWIGYKSLIPKSLHRILHHGINRLERFHYTFRQKVKRLSRKTMSYSKSEFMLEVSIKLFCCRTSIHE